MARRSRIYNPTNYIKWRDNLETFTRMSLTLTGMVRILIDQATGTGTLNDYPVTGDIFWPSQQLYDAGNEALVDFWPMLARQPIPLQGTSVTLTVTTATDVYAFNSAVIMIPSYVVLNTHLTNGQTIDQKYWTSDLTKLEQNSRNWRDYTPAQPTHFILWDALHVRCFPIPDKTYNYTLFGVPWPTELSTGTEDISADPILKLSVAYKTAANILEATRPDTADSYIKESEELLNRYRIRLRDQQTNNLRRLKPGVGSRYTDQTMAAMKGVIQIGRRQS